MCDPYCFVRCCCVLAIGIGLGASCAALPAAQERVTATSVASRVPAPAYPAPAAPDLPTTAYPAPAPPPPDTPASHTAAYPAPTSAGATLPAGGTPTYTYRIVATYPHDRTAFTQGLVIADGALYEGTGQYGKSTLRRVDLESGAVLQQHALPGQFFGEGITIYGDRIYQLTWQSKIGFVYDRQTFEQLGTFDYPTEGWGITHDGTRLIMSDGTATLHFLDPTTLTETGRIEVYDEHGPVVRLNELEYINGEIFANVWQTDRIVRIDPQTGRVTARIDLTGLLRAEDRVQPVDVLNGIAYDAARNRLLVTGKLWPRLFEIELIPAG